MVYGSSARPGVLADPPRMVGVYYNTATSRRHSHCLHVSQVGTGSCSLELLTGAAHSLAGRSGGLGGTSIRGEAAQGPTARRAGVDVSRPLLTAVPGCAPLPARRVAHLLARPPVCLPTHRPHLYLLGPATITLRFYHPVCGWPSYSTAPYGACLSSCLHGAPGGSTACVWYVDYGQCYGRLPRPFWPVHRVASALASPAAGVGGRGWASKLSCGTRYSQVASKLWRACEKYHVPLPLTEGAEDQ